MPTETVTTEIMIHTYQQNLENSWECSEVHQVLEAAAEAATEAQAKYRERANATEDDAFHQWLANKADLLEEWVIRIDRVQDTIQVSCKEQGDAPRFGHIHQVKEKAAAVLAQVPEDYR